MPRSAPGDARRVLHPERVEDGGASEYTNCAGGLDVVLVYGGVDSATYFYYGVDGKLVAVDRTFRCLAGPPGFLRSAGLQCGAGSGPPCCDRQGTAAEVGCPVNGRAQDAGKD